MEYKAFLEQIYIRHSPNVKLGLERMYDILKNMDYPNAKLKGIHIAGTNGKGSTCAITESLLLSHQHTTGLNTSPHLVDYTERFRLNGQVISVDDLMQLYDKYADNFEGTEASFFEITTALAFQYFYDNQVDSSIFEVGLGGRLDGTNPFKSTVSIITSISFDHTKSLGDTIEKIAFEKAGIIKNNTPVVIGNLTTEALNVILKQANSLNANTYIYNKDFFVKNEKLTQQGSYFDYEFPEYSICMKNLHTNMIGEHQIHNTALALTAFFIYFDKINQSFEENKIRQAISSVNWTGRMQVLSTKPLVIIDGAHNSEGVEALINNLKMIYPEYNYHFLVAILRDKNLEEMIENICSVATRIYITKNISERAAEIEDQVNIVKKYDVEYYAEDDIIVAAEKCFTTLDKNKDMMIITGSLYTISEILKIENKMFA